MKEMQTEEVLEALKGVSTTLEVAAQAFGFKSLNAAYRAANRGEFPTIRVGRKYVVPCAPLRKMLGVEG